MTKRHELAILDRAIAELTPCSYLGPWLQSSRAELEAQMSSDLVIAPEYATPAAAQKEAARILEAARSEAADVTERAREAARRQQEETIRAIAELKRQARQALERFANQINP